MIRYSSIKDVGTQGEWIQTKREAGMYSANKKHLMELMDEAGVEILTKKKSNRGHSLDQM